MSGLRTTSKRPTTVASRQRPSAKADVIWALKHTTFAAAFAAITISWAIADGAETGQADAKAAPVSAKTAPGTGVTKTANGDTTAKATSMKKAVAKKTPSKAAQKKKAPARNTAPLRGILVPKREVLLTSLSADRVKAVKVVEGDRVKAGEMLVTLSCDDANAEYSIAKARLKQYKLLHGANAELIDEDAITMLDFALSEAKVEEGEGELAFAKAQIKKCALSAPYDAVVVNVAVEEFANVQVGEPLVSLVDDKRYELVINVPSSWVQWRQMYSQATFSVSIDETQRRYQAVVKRIGASIDATSRTVELVAEIVGDHEELAPGMTGNTDLSPPAELTLSQQ